MSLFVFLSVFIFSLIRDLVWSSEIVISRFVKFLFNCNGVTVVIHYLPSVKAKNLSQIFQNIPQKGYLKCLSLVMASLNEIDAINIMLIILRSASEDGEGDGSKMVTMITNNNRMYRALFNHPQLRGYWEALIQKGLLRYDLDTQTFKITAEGHSFLKSYSGMDYDMIKARPPSSRRRLLQTR